MHVEIGANTVQKRLTGRERAEPEALRQLQTEIAALERLRGGPVPVLVTHGDDYLETARLPYPTLDARMPVAGPWVSSAIAPAFEALAWIHARGVVHGDLSPGNVAISDALEVTFLDFGLAVLPDASRPPDGAFRGTLAYVAPEVARGEAPTAASDRFALAATFAHLVRGAPLREGPFAAVLARAAEEPIDTTGLDPRLAACLAFDPAQRRW